VNPILLDFLPSADSAAGTPWVPKAGAEPRDGQPAHRAGPGTAHRQACRCGAGTALRLPPSGAFAN